ncbi:MAG: hypothetical protein AAFU64_16425, partial [Bacteroidota bacterium]
LITFNLSLSTDGNGSALASPSGPYVQGASVSVEATPNAGFRFLNWTDGNGVALSIDNPYVFSINSDLNLTANFEAIPAYTLTLETDSNGVVNFSPQPPYFEGTEITLNPVPNAGFSFLNWTDINGIEVSMDNPLIFNITEDTYYKANFQETVFYSLTLLSDGNGVASAALPGPYEVGSLVSVSALANPGYRFLNWSDGLGNNVSTSNPYDFNITQDTTLQANFELIPTFTLSLSSNGNGSANASAPGPYEVGSTVTVTATPNSGAQFDNWTDANGVIVSTDNPYSFTINANASLSANFSDAGSGITALVLVDAVTDQDIMVLQDGAQIDLFSLPSTSLTIRADAPSPLIESVQMNLTGALSKFTTESVPPYALFGDINNTDFIGQAFGLGSYTISATPYSGNGGNGTPGNTVT